MNLKPELKLDWATHKAAKYAVENWHYSKCLPVGKTVKVGVWEENKFVGVVLFGMGSGNATCGTKYGLAKTHEVAELTRVALTTHKAPVSRIISVAIKMFKHQSPGIRLLISFSDEMGQGHIGGIYQAGNWLYLGAFKEGDGGYCIFGRSMHTRSVGAKGWKQTLGWLKKHIDPNATKLPTKKHRYVMPLDDDMKKRLKSL